MNYAGSIAAFSAADNSASFKSKQKITGKIDAIIRRKNFEIFVPLKYSSNYWRTLEIPLIDCEKNLILTWSKSCVFYNDTKATTFAITNTKLYVSVVTLSTQDNVNLLHQLKLGFKRTTNWNKHQSKVTIQAPKPYLDYLINPSFQEVNKLFVLSFEINADRTVHNKYYLPTLEIKDCNFITLQY